MTAFAREHGGESCSWGDPLLLDSTVTYRCGRWANPNPSERFFLQTGKVASFMSFSTQRVTCSQVALQTPALKAEGTLGGPKITEVTGNTVGVLLSVVIDSLVLSEVELFLSQRGFVIDGRKGNQCTQSSVQSLSLQCYNISNE